MAQIEIHGLEKIYDKLRDVNNISRVLGPPMTQSMMHLQRRMARIPKRGSGPGRNGWTSEKQRRYYWHMVSEDRKHGGGRFLASGAYRRTGTLARKWSFKVQAGAGGVEGTLTNNAPGAVYVQGERQQRFHAVTGWPTVDDTVEKNAKQVQGYFNAAIKRVINE